MPALDRPDAKILRMFKFRTGNEIAVFWNEPTLVWVARAHVNFPEGDMVPYMVQVVHPFRSQIFGLLRLALAKKRNPKLKEVTEKMQPQKVRAFHLAGDAHRPMKLSVDGKELIEGKDFILRGEEILLK